MRINQFNGYILYTVYQKKDLQMSIFSKIIFIDQLTCTLIKAKKQDKNDMLIKVFISFHFSFSKKEAWLYCVGSVKLHRSIKIKAKF